MNVRLDRPHVHTHAPVPLAAPVDAPKTKPVARRAADTFANDGTTKAADEPVGTRSRTKAPLPQRAIDHAARSDDPQELAALVYACTEADRPALAAALEAAMRREAAMAHQPMPPSGIGAQRVERALAQPAETLMQALAARKDEPWPSRVALLQTINATYAPDAARELSALLVSWMLAGESDPKTEALIDTMLELAVRETKPEELRFGLRALDVLSPAQRERLFAATPKREDQRELYAATFMREAPALAAQGEQGRIAEARLLAAGKEIATLGPKATAAAAYAGIVGFEAKTLVEIHPKDRPEPALKVPLRFHPGVPEKDRAAIIALVQQSLALFPAAIVERMLKGHDDEPPLLIAIAPSYHADFYGQFVSPTSTLTLNADDARMPLHFEETIAHELTHAVMDDLRRGAITNLEQSRSSILRDSAAGTPLLLRYNRMLVAYATLLQDPEVLAMNDAQRETYLNAKLQELGAVNFYALSQGLDEFVAESFAYFLVPARRAQLERADPQLTKVFTRVIELLAAKELTLAREVLLLGTDPQQAVMITVMTLGAREGPLDESEKARLKACQETIRGDAALEARLDAARAKRR